MAIRWAFYSFPSEITCRLLVWQKITISPECARSSVIFSFKCSICYFLKSRLLELKFKHFLHIAVTFYISSHIAVIRISNWRKNEILKELRSRTYCKFFIYQNIALKTRTKISPLKTYNCIIRVNFYSKTRKNITMPSKKNNNWRNTGMSPIRPNFSIAVFYSACLFVDVHSRLARQLGLTKQNENEFVAWKTWRMKWKSKCLIRSRRSFIIKIGVSWYLHYGKKPFEIWVELWRKFSQKFVTLHSAT